VYSEDIEVYGSEDLKDLAFLQLEDIALDNQIS
jgi:hypothetical protein